MSPTRENEHKNSPSHSQNASTNMTKIENHIDVRRAMTSVPTMMFYGMYENLIGTLQQTPCLYLSSHTVIALKVHLSFCMTLNFIACMFCILYLKLSP